MSNINSINMLNSTPRLETPITVGRKVNLSTPQDSIQLTSKKNNPDLTQTDNSKVTFKEGLKLICNGFKNKVKDLAKSIIKHPIKTAGIMLGTTLALSALPLIGISTALGASVLAAGFAGIAIGKTAVHTVKAIKHNKNGEYAQLRNDLGKIGGDCLDLALSMPFLPKALKNIKRNIQYAPKLCLNKELLSNIKNAKGVGAKYTELLKGDLQINYETIGNEMGLKTKPKLVFDDNMQFDLTKGIATAGEYEPTTGVMKINPKTLNPLARILTRTNPEAILKHELTHFQQFADIARTEGIGVTGLKNNLIEYYKKALDLGETSLPADNIRYAKNLVHGDGSIFNSEFYESIVKEQGVIAKGTEEALKAQTYMDGLIAKVSSDVEKIRNLNISPFFSTPNDMKKVLEVYKANPLETPAYAAQDLYTKEILKLRPNITNDIIASESISQDE